MTTITIPAAVLDVLSGHGVNVDNVLGYMERTTARRAVAVGIREAGHDNPTGAAIATEAWGVNVKKGGFGNLVNDGLRDLGRGGEIQSTGGGGKRVTPVIDQLRSTVATLSDQLAAVDGPIVEAEGMIHDLGTKKGREAAVAAEVARLRESMAAIEARIAAVEADPSAFIEAEQARATGKLNAAREGAEERRATIEKELEAARTALQALGG